MAELLLDSHDLQAIDRLLAPAVDGDSSDDLLPVGVLRALTELFALTVAGVSEINRHGGEPLRTRTFPPQADDPCEYSLRVTLQADTGPQVVHVFLGRAGPAFTVRDRVLFRLLTPMLEERVVAALSHRPVTHGLSPCELRVLTLVAKGASNREVSDALSVSVATVRKHLEHVYDKLGVRSRTAAVAMVFPQTFAS